MVVTKAKVMALVNIMVDGCNDNRADLFEDEGSLWSLLKLLLTRTLLSQTTSYHEVGVIPAEWDDFHDTTG